MSYVKKVSWQRNRPRRRGAAAVELAFVLPVVLLFILGAIDFARIMYANTTVSEAARCGARYAMVHGSMSVSPAGPAANDGSVANVVQSAALALDPTQLTVTSSWDSGTNDASSPVTVTATYNCQTWISRVLGLGPAITVQGSTTMLITH